jgi:hypothetical protein
MNEKYRVRFANAFAFFEYYDPERSNWVYLDNIDMNYHPLSSILEFVKHRWYPPGNFDLEEVKRQIRLLKSKTVLPI